LEFTETVTSVRLSSSVHFVGISGIGMSALARILLARGFRVSGSSDRATPLTAKLAEEGATISIGHVAKNLGAAGTVVVSSAIPEDNPEVRAAREANLEIVHRSALLALLMSDRRGIAIAGTHGKTTATAMVATVLEAGGLDPTVVVGGERGESGNARDGHGEWFVAESDESDGSFLGLHPEIAVVTNVENDHVTSDAEFVRMVDAFGIFLDQIAPSGLALVGIDSPRSAALARRSRGARTRTFGFAAGAELRARDAIFENFGSRSALTLDGEPLGTLALAVPGEINIQDALPAVAIGLELGLSFKTIAAALAGFSGVHRRFEVLSRTPRMTVVDDYAHHPTAVGATIAAARAGFAGPIVAVFQPHRYSRTAYLAGDFARALRGADRVVLTDVYAASEAPIDGATAAAIGEPLRALGSDVAYVGDVRALPAHLLANVPAGALVLFLGAGSITTAAATLARELREAVLS
jgi:UDP-N-acetylmuramate--alanine ligase